MKKISFYQIKNSFASAFQDEKIKVFLELFSRAHDNQFCKEQFDLIVENVDRNRLHDLLLSRYENRNDFSYEKDCYHLINLVCETEEFLRVYDDHLELEYKAKKSQFYEFLTMFYPSLLAIDEKNEKISPLRLVKP